MTPVKTPRSEQKLPHKKVWAINTRNATQVLFNQPKSFFVPIKWMWGLPMGGATWHFPRPRVNRSRTLHTHQGGGRENFTAPCNRIKPVVAPFQPAGIAITIPFRGEQRRHAPFRRPERKAFIRWSSFVAFEGRKRKLFMISPKLFVFFHLISSFSS